MTDKSVYIIFCGAICFNAAANILVKAGMLNKTGLFDHGLIMAVLRIITDPLAFLGITSFGILYSTAGYYQDLIFQ